jgi:hypothetical protein
MAYVVARPEKRFEIRESIHTPKGPRARSLANFAVLTDAVVAAAQAWATRPFDAVAVRAAAGRAGAPAELTVNPEDPAVRHFVEASRRMATELERPPPGPGPRRDPGTVLMELLGFADQITGWRARRAPEPLAFPVLSRLAERSSAKVATAATVSEP